MTLLLLGRGRGAGGSGAGSGGGSFTPNRPAGLTDIFDTTLDSIGTSPGATPGGLYYNVFMPGGGSVVSTPGAPHSANSLEFRFPAGDVGGAGGPASLTGASGRRWSALYVAVAVRLSASYVVHSNEEKFFYPRVSDGASPAALNLAWLPVSDPQSGGIRWHGRSWRPDGGGINVFSEPQGAPPYMTRGVWHTIETFIQLNAPGQYDGTLQTWLDGAPQLDRRDVRFYADAQPRFLDQLLWDATRGGGTDAGSAVPAQGQTRWFNRIAVSAVEAP